MILTSIKFHIDIQNPLDVLAILSSPSVGAAAFRPDGLAELAHLC